MVCGELASSAVSAGASSASGESSVGAAAAIRGIIAGARVTGSGKRRGNETRGRDQQRANVLPAHARLLLLSILDPPNAGHFIFSNFAHAVRRESETNTAMSPSQEGTYTKRARSQSHLPAAPVSMIGQPCRRTSERDGHHAGHLRQLATRDGGAFPGRCGSQDLRDRSEATSDSTHGQCSRCTSSGRRQSANLPPAQTKRPRKAA